MCCDTNLCWLCGKSTVRQRKICIYGTGATFLIIAIILAIVWPLVSDEILNSHLILEKGTANYKRWLGGHYTKQYMKIYVFDWLNPEDFEKPNIKPIFNETGPYIFEEVIERVDMIWHDNGTLSYAQQRNWNFIPSDKRDKLSRIVNTPNIFKATNPSLNAPASLKLTVQEILFDGFQNAPIGSSKLNKRFKQSFPEKFAWFSDYKSPNYDGRFNLFTGRTDIGKLGHIHTWNYKQETEIYPSPCGDVVGTTGELWPPNLNPSTSNTMFSIDICRRVTLRHKEALKIHDIPGRKLVLDERTFDHGLTYSETSCFCPNIKEDSKRISTPSQNSKNDECLNLYAGVSDISQCRENLNNAGQGIIFISFPHFLFADRRYAEAIAGMMPTADQHEFSISLESRTGVPLQSHIRFQFNIRMERGNNRQRGKKNKAVRDSENSIMLPTLWYSQEIEIDEDSADIVKMGIYIPNIGSLFGYMLIPPGIALLLIGVVLTITKTWKLPKSDIVMLSRGDYLKGKTGLENTIVPTTNITGIHVAKMRPLDRRNQSSQDLKKSGSSVKI